MLNNNLFNNIKRNIEFYSVSENFFIEDENLLAIVKNKNIKIIK
jgi:hypothetical protein